MHIINKNNVFTLFRKYENKLIKEENIAKYSCIRYIWQMKQDIKLIYTIGTISNQKKLLIVVEPFLSFIFILCKLKEFYFSSDTRQSRLGNLLTEKAVRMDRELNKVCVLDY